MCLERVQQEVGDVLEVRWKSFLLRPYPEPKPLEKFRRYTESWLRPAGAADAGEFRVWATDEDPPSHSVPPAVAVKAAARQGAFSRYHTALMHAYFAENRNVTSSETIAAVARQCGLDLEIFARDMIDPALAQEVIADHNEAVALGIHSVPCVVLDGGFQMPGAQERALYRSVIEKVLAKRQSS
ncbi:MAG: DsbA family protein [Deltaproteobacteria bacterium]|nr:DsbA family protein [Deltaproteobacteria bacterium]